MKTYYIKLNYANRFCRIDEIGNVLETENGKMEPNRYEWRITGAWYQKPFGHTGYINLKQLLQLDNWLYKNGNPIYGLTDIDHGTSREQGNKNVHGVRYICAESR